MKLVVVADTGAAISLALSGLFDACKSHFLIIIGEKIASELEEIGLVDDDLGIAAKIVLENMDMRSTGKIFERGEDEALELLSGANADILISDDIEFVKKNRNNEKISFSIVLFGILLEKNVITKKSFLDAVNKMFEKREWGENLIYLVAKNIFDDN